MEGNEDHGVPLDVKTISVSDRPLIRLPKNMALSGSKVFTKSYYEYWKGREPLVENSNATPRTLTPFEQAGNNIMITIKTTLAYHRTRVQLLLDPWISVVNASNVFLVTDGEDMEYEAKARNFGE